MLLSSLPLLFKISLYHQRATGLDYIESQIHISYVIFNSIHQVMNKQGGGSKHLRSKSYHMPA
jgi:hypothetical protein